MPTPLADRLPSAPRTALPPAKSFGKRNVVPFLFGLVLAPLFIVLHEGGHFLAASALGLHPKFHYAGVTNHASAPRAAYTSVVLTAAGPALQALLAAVGLLWLYVRRRNHRFEPATCADWLATWLALNAGRWAAGIGLSLLSGSRLADEAFLSVACGIPPSLGIFLLALVGWSVLLLVFRLHPPGSRLVPFASAGIGGLLGINLWLHLVGPRLLP